MRIDLCNLTAKHIMGWELLEINYYGTPEATPRQVELHDWIDEMEINAVGLYWIDVEKDFWINASGYSGWFPTMKLGQAWQILGKFPNTEYVIDITRRNDDLWSVRVADRKTRETAWYADEKIEIAICMAALAAKGVDIAKES